MVALNRSRSVQLDALSVCIHTRVPVLLWGDPGIGKTSTVVQLAQTLGLHLETVIAAIREPTDFAGLPYISKRISVRNRKLVVTVLAKQLQITEDDVEHNLAEVLAIFGSPAVSGGVVSFAPPLWAKNLLEKGKGILFLDEISTARPAVQTALLRVVLEGVVGDIALPKGIAVVAAANPPDQIAGGWDLTAPLANRFIHLDWKLDPERWVEGFTYGWPAPDILKVSDDWEKEYPEMRVFVGAFIKSKPELLHNVPKVETARGRAWPSPRSWDAGTRLLAAAKTTNLDPDTKRELEIVLLKGAVGGAALEFLTYRDNLDLPDPEEILKAPEQAKLPTRDDQLYATLAGVVFAIKNRNTPDRWHRGWKVLDLAVRTKTKDVAMAHAYTLAQNKPNGASAPNMAVFLDVFRKAGILGNKA